jgi:hypothetical protein
MARKIATLALAAAAVLLAAAAAPLAARAAPAPANSKGSSHGKGSKGGSSCPNAARCNLVTAADLAGFCPAAPSACNLATLDNVYAAIDFAGYVGDVLLRYYEPGLLHVFADVEGDKCAIGVYKDNAVAGEAACTAAATPASPTAYVRLTCPLGYTLATNSFCAGYVISAENKAVAFLPLAGSGALNEKAYCIVSTANAVVPPGGRILVEAAAACAYDDKAFDEAPPAAAQTEKVGAAVSAFGAAGKAARGSGAGGAAFEPEFTSTLTIKP